MGAMLASLLFGTTFIVAVWAMVTTIAPKAAYIRQLLTGYEPSTDAQLPAQVALRSSRLTVRQAVPARSPYWRAAA